MIEMPTVSSSKRFSYNNDTHRNRENSEADFSELAKNAGLIDEKSQRTDITGADAQRRDEEKDSVVSLAAWIATVNCAE